MTSYVKKCILFCFLIVSGCSKKEVFKKEPENLQQLGIFIGMPENLTVLENISSSVHEILSRHFQRVGFNLLSKKNSDFKIYIKILGLEYPERFVSPDVLPYALKVKISFECKLFDKHDKLITSKKFSFLKWLNRSRDPVLNWTYLHVQYRKLIEESVPRIDQFFRPFMLLDK
ncbi:hypothetical protein KAW80_00180 [Candidatus Babeliales bacterium]|nr:hypothetical protein [Candidatus Babeliales bacterium]